MALPPANQSFVQRFGARLIIFVIAIGVLAILVIAALGSCATSVNNTEVAIVVNNVTGTTSKLESGGMVMHLPFGLSSVYLVDKSQRVLYLTHTHANKEHPQGDSVNIKTNDGSNVDVEIEVVYQLQGSRAEDAYRELGEQENIEDILRAVTRSEIRNQFGELSTLEISDPIHRSAKLKVTQDHLANEMREMGIEVVSVNAQNFKFDEEYDRIIRDRKEADQILLNQKDYQDTAVEEGKRMIAEATRDKETALAQLQGDLNKKILTAEGEAKRILTKAQQTAYQAENEGNIAMKTSEQEALAILAEGQRKAEAMDKLFQAYEKGGEGLVKEALVKFYEGIVLKARPYSPSEKIERLQNVPNVKAQSVQGGANGN